MRAHRGNAKNGMDLPVYRWMRKHGIENILMTPLSVHESRADMGIAEARAIQTHRTHVSMGGLNVTLGGDGGRGFKHSAETRAAMSRAHTGMKRSPEAVAKIAAANRGSKRTDEQKRRISESITGRKLSADHRAKLAKKLTDEQVREIMALRGIAPQAEIGRRYGVTPSMVSQIHRGVARATT